MNDFGEISNYLKAIGDPTRLNIIHLLNKYSNPLCVNAIAKKLNVTQSAVSQHLRILKQVGLVTGRREGYHIHYEINTEKFQQYTRHLGGIIFPSESAVKDNCVDDCD
jgi:ArsR family transcriptional regulator, arsenate/arsenite/antimonite-responsive transcriptional repressor